MPSSTLKPSDSSAAAKNCMEKYDGVDIRLVHSYRPSYPRPHLYSHLHAHRYSHLHSHPKAEFDSSAAAKKCIEKYDGVDMGLGTKLSFTALP